MTDRNTIAMAIEESIGTNREALGKIRTRVFSVKKDKDGDEGGKSKAVNPDPLQTLVNQGKIVEPPYDMLTLSMLPENNTELEQCIEAMETNIDGFGHRFVPRIKPTATGDVPKKTAKAIRAEHVKLENFFGYATPEPFVEFRRKLRVDLEATGNAYMEVIRGMDGQIQGFTHLPGYQMRLGAAEDDFHSVDRPIFEVQDDGSVVIVKRRFWRRFRTYVQCKSTSQVYGHATQSHAIRWFKEFGDDRVYDNGTGKVSDEELPDNQTANEVIHLKIYSPRTPYGLPRFRGNLLSILGDRAAEEINFITFQNNNIPSMVIAVSNGQLTSESIERIESFVESCIQGSSNYSKFLLLEGEGMIEGEDGGQIKIEIKPLTAQQHDDQLFQDYSANNQDKVRRSYRLPPIFVGRSDDYTRATAHSSRQLADEQIFAPERGGYDARMNRDIFPDLGIVYHLYKSNSPNTTDNTELVKILAGSEKTGGMTPRVAKTIIEDILSTTLPPFKEGYDPDLPFSLTMAAAVKNQADATEPGQQVTALKILGGGLEDQETGDPMIDHLLDVWKGLDTTWNEEVGDEHLDGKRVVRKSPVSRKERNKKRLATIKHEH